MSFNMEEEKKPLQIMFLSQDLCLGGERLLVKSRVLNSRLRNYNILSFNMEEGSNQIKCCHLSKIKKKKKNQQLNEYK